MSAPSGACPYGGRLLTNLRGGCFLIFLVASLACRSFVGSYPALPAVNTRSRLAETARPAATLLEPPSAPPREDERSGDSASVLQCEVTADFRGDAFVSGGTRPGSEVWLFRRVYTNEFSQLLRKMGYHLPMIFQNVSVSCAEMSLGELWRQTCQDCIRHLTADAYGELGMIVPAHPDPDLRGRNDAPPVEATVCLLQGADYSASSPDSGLFCRTRLRSG
eukprot:s15_g10.t1